MTLPLLSRPILADLGGAIGTEKLDRLIVRFTASLRTAFAGADKPPGERVREAHTLISMSGMLGCERLSAACRALEAEGKAGADLTRSLAEIRILRDDTVRELESLASGAPHRCVVSPQAADAVSR